MTDQRTDSIQPDPAPANNEAPATPDAVEANRAAAADANQNGPDSEIVECPTCHNPRRKFLIVDGKCDSCRTKDQPAAIVATLGWPEVRARRDRLIAASDWSQLPDVSDEVAGKFSPLRKRLRDVTKFDDPFKAWYELDAIEAEAAK